jgi:hypothetical protein
MVDKRAFVRYRQADKIREREEAMLRSFFVDSLNAVYLCKWCERNYKKHIFFASKDELFKHYVKEHNFKLVAIPPKDPHDMCYIILKHLVEQFKQSKGRYIKVTCKELHRQLTETLKDDSISNQQPAHILRKLGVLEQVPGRKKKLGYNKYGNRVYHISKEDIERTVDTSPFHDLRIQFGLITFDEVCKASGFKVLSVPKDNDTKETKEFKKRKKDIDGSSWEDIQDELND